MTIALGILASGGVVVAADRQETSGYFKGSASKVQSQWVANRGTLIVSGAGDGPYIDSVSDDLKRWFSDTSQGYTRIETADVEAELRRLHTEFYSRNVLPASQWGGREDVPDYDLLVAYGSPSNEHSIWTTHKLAVVKENEFAAVGIGASAAKTLIQRLGHPFLELPVAFALAVYVAYHVKQTVDTVGLNTDVLVARKSPHGSAPWLIRRDDILEMERIFDERGETIERDTLYYCLGGDLDCRERMFGQVGDTKQSMEAMRAFFQKVAEKWNVATQQSKPQQSRDQQ